VAAVIDEDVKPIVRAEHVIEIVRQRLGVRHQNGLLIENRMTIDSDSSPAAGVPDDTFVSIPPLTIQSAAVQSEADQAALRARSRGSPDTAPRCLQTGLKRRRSIVTEFARRLGDIAPTRVNLAAAASFVVNPEIRVRKPSERATSVCSVVGCPQPS